MRRGSRQGRLTDPFRVPEESWPRSARGSWRSFRAAMLGGAWGLVALIGIRFAPAARGRRGCMAAWRFPPLRPECWRPVPSHTISNSFCHEIVQHGCHSSPSKETARATMDGQAEAHWRVIYESLSMAITDYEGVECWAR